jgi:hypothetical protein
MSQPDIILEYRGPVNFDVIESLLMKLKSDGKFKGFDKTTGKRVYALVAECLENILKHSAPFSPADKKIQPNISVSKEKDKVIISTGNIVTNHQADKVALMLDKINQLDELSLRTLYENKINMDFIPKENGAGLGFIIMRLRSGNNIEYSCANTGKELSYFHMKISINRYTMRKLMIEQTSNSPGVIFDPDKNLFEISGESRPFDVTAFYTEILNWTNDYNSYLDRSEEGIKPAVFNLDFEYFNSSSAKYLLDFCKLLAAARSKGHDITVRWHYEENDVDMLEAGKEMSGIAKLPFEYVQKE